MEYEDIERRRLRRERERLNRQIDKLVAAGARINDASDPLERAAHGHDLDRHLREFRVFREDLDRFQRRYGPLGQ